jgi:hypothetical protein
MENEALLPYPRSAARDFDAGDLVAGMGECSGMFLENTRR